MSPASPVMMRKGGVAQTRDGTPPRQRLSMMMKPYNDDGVQRDSLLGCVIPTTRIEGMGRVAKMTANKEHSNCMWLE